MNKKKIAPKLSLTKKTIASLSKQEEQYVIGAGPDTNRQCPFETRFRDCLTRFLTRCGNSCD